MRAALALPCLALLLPAAGCSDPDPLAAELVERHVRERAEHLGVDFIDCTGLDADASYDPEIVATCLDAAWATCEPAWGLLFGCDVIRWLVIAPAQSGPCEVELFDLDASEERLVQRTCAAAELAPDSCDRLAVTACGEPFVHDVGPPPQEL